MKKRYLVLTALLALSLAACSQEKAKNEDGEAKTEQTAKADGTVGSKSQGTAQKKAEVVNKGDYYSIQGKYDEIIVANKHYPLSKDYNPGKIQQLRQSWSNSSKPCKRQGSQSVTITVALEVMKLRPSSIKIMSIKMGKKLPTVILLDLVIANTRQAWPLM